MRTSRLGAIGLTRAAAVVMGMLAGCARPPAPPREIGLTLAPAGADTRLTLVAVPGLKVNARLKPALELSDGTVLRFDSPLLTPDSAYFAEPPTALLAGRRDHVTGTLRASVCGVDQRVCRGVTVQL